MKRVEKRMDRRRRRRRRCLEEAKDIYNCRIRTKTVGEKDARIMLRPSQNQKMVIRNQSSVCAPKIEENI